MGVREETAILRGNQREAITVACFISRSVLNLLDVFLHVDSHPSSTEASLSTLVVGVATKSACCRDWIRGRCWREMGRGRKEDTLNQSLEQESIPGKGRTPVSQGPVGEHRAAARPVWSSAKCGDMLASWGAAL